MFLILHVYPARYCKNSFLTVPQSIYHEHSENGKSVVFEYLSHTDRAS